MCDVTFIRIGICIAIDRSTEKHHSDKVEEEEEEEVV